MRFFINAMLAFALVGLIGGLLPVSAQQLARLRGMKTELAAVQDPHLVKLRLSLPR